MASINNDIRVRRSSPSISVIAGIALASLLLSLFASLMPLTVSAAESSFKSPTDTDAANQWNSANNALTANSDNVFAFADHDDYDQGFDEFGGFSLPSGATITGILVEIDAKQEGTTCQLQTKLSWNDANNFTTYKTLVPVSDNDDEILSYGGAGDTWDRVWAVSDFSNANFVVEIRHNDPGPGCNTGGGNRDSISVDYIRVKVYYNPANTAPVATAGSATTNEDTAVSGTLTASDSDTPAQTLTYSVVANPAHGTVTGLPNTTGAFTYTPAANYNGSDSFTFRANDGTANSNTAAISLTVAAQNDAPVATAASVSTHVDTALLIVLAGTDVDLDSLTFATTSEPTNGVLSGTAPNLTYTPNTGYVGNDSFTFSVTDGTLSGSATISIVVDNGAPTLAAIADQVIDELVAFTLTASATDPDSDPVTYSLTDLASTGAVIDSNTGVMSWTPTEAQGAGVYQFIVVASDGLLTDSKNFQVTVGEINVAPAADSQSVTTTQDTNVSGTVTGTDADLPANTLTFATTSNPTNGTLTAFDTNTGAFTYAPNSGYTGSDSFTFSVTDGALTSATDGTVSITVNAPAPVPPPSNGGGSGSGGGGGVVSGPFSIGFVNTNPTAGGTVLGTSTEVVLGTSTDALPLGCELYIGAYLKQGSTDVSQVKKLQTFLNTHMSAGLPVTGIFGKLTFEAVKAFQLKYWQEVLAPWVPFGLSSAQTSTGYVYKTTQRMINLVQCNNSVVIPQPQLP